MVKVKDKKGRPDIRENRYMKVFLRNHQERAEKAERAEVAEVAEVAEELFPFRGQGQDYPFSIFFLSNINCL